MKTPSFLTRPVQASLFWGILGGIFLIVITFFSNKGLIQILPYPIILISSVLFFKFNDTSDRTFRRMLISGVCIFIIMSLILSIYVLAFVNKTYNFSPSLEVLRLTFITIIGFFSSLLLAVLAKPIRQ